jgi:hypothetical protein
LLYFLQIQVEQVIEKVKKLSSSCKVGRVLGAKMGRLGHEVRLVLESRITMPSNIHA